MKEGITREELDEVFDMMCMGGLDPNPPTAVFNIGGIIKYAKENNKEYTELTREEIDRFKIRD